MLGAAAICSRSLSCSAWGERCAGARVCQPRRSSVGKHAMVSSIKMRPAPPAAAAGGGGGRVVVGLGAAMADRSGAAEEAAPAGRAAGRGRGGPGSPRSLGPAGVAMAAQ